MAVYETWFGINQDQHFNSLHVHPASTVSGVLYIHLGTDSSSLWVVDPRLGAWHPEANQLLCVVSQDRLRDVVARE